MEIRSIIINHLNKNGFSWDDKNSNDERMIYRMNLNDSLFIVVELTKSMIHVCSGLMRNGDNFLKTTTMLLNVLQLFDKPLNHFRDMIDQTMANCINQMLNFENEDERPLKGAESC